MPATPVEEAEAPPVPAKERPIIVIRKKVSGHGGHHGGAWKVAYADFVTAMMALFIVLWLMNASKQVQEAVGGYSGHSLVGLAAISQASRDFPQHLVARGVTP